MAEPVQRVEDLYAVELSDFVRERNALAARLKAAGDKDGAAEVKAMRKPPRSAWALNVMARAEPAVVEAVLDAARGVAAAVGGAGGDVRAAQGDYTRAVTAAVEAAAATSGLDGDQVTERMRTTLLAAGAEPDGEVAAHLRAGTLADDAEAPGFSFAGMALEPEPPPAPESAPTEEPDDEADDRSAEREAAAQRAAEQKAAAEEAAAAEAAAAAERRRARRRAQLERQVGRLSQQLTRLTERAEAAEAAAEEARAAVRSAQDELADLAEQLGELEHPDG